MKIEELCIGDLVLVHKPTCKGHRVDYINEMEEGIGADGEIYDVCDIKPIPLTPEILEKNGFEKEIISGDTYFTLDDIVLENNYEFGIYFGRFYRASEDGFVFVDTIAIKYVYQLQHLLRLCGVDKEIKI